MREMMDFSKMD